MDADVKLQDQDVIVEGHALKVNGWDIMLDGGRDRRLNTEAGQEGYRRALVHEEGDKLTLNFEGDYLGGVKVDGTMTADELYVAGRHISNTLRELDNQIADLRNQLTGLERIARAFSDASGLLHAQLTGDLQCRNVSAETINLHGIDLKPWMSNINSWLSNLDSRLSELAHQVEEINVHE